MDTYAKNYKFVRSLNSNYVELINDTEYKLYDNNNEFQILPQYYNDDIEDYTTKSCFYRINKFCIFIKNKIIICVEYIINKCIKEKCENYENYENNINYVIHENPIKKKVAKFMKPKINLRTYSHNLDCITEL